MARPEFLAVVPMKPLAESKTRLHPHLSRCRRATLSLSMLNWVLGVLKSVAGAQTLVVGGDGRVGDAVRRAGACWADDIRLDLNEAVEYGFCACESGESAGVLSFLPICRCSRREISRGRLVIRRAAPS